MHFDFDEPIDRRGTNCVKWDGMATRLGLPDPDVIPMWVADMDFRAAPPINQALMDLASHGVQGYFGDETALHEAITGWMRRRHGWEVSPDTILNTHGVVSGICLCLQAFSEPGDGVVVFSPVYHMFGNTVRANGRRLIESPLREIQGRYEMDLDGLPDLIDARTRMVLLCSPHNPGGRVWTGEELRALAAFCADNDLILVSDEIHHDLVYDGAKHIVTETIAPEISDRLVTLFAATKTFNIASALTGHASIANPALREKFQQRRAAAGVGATNRLGAMMVAAAYAGGEPWLDALLPYLHSNRDHLNKVVAADLPGVRSMPMEATYLAWLDFTGLDMDHEEVVDRVERRAKIAVNKGPAFGAGGDHHLRFNFACPRATLDTALERLVEAFA